MKQFIDKIKRILYWGWVLRNNHDWDHVYLEKVMLLKLQRMRACFNAEEYHHNRWSLNTEIQTTTSHADKECLLAQYKADVALDICIEILKRKTSNDFYDRISGLKALYDRSEFSFSDDTILWKLDGKQATAADTLLKKNLHAIRVRVEKRDNKLLYQLMEKYSQFWWS